MMYVEVDVQRGAPLCANSVQEVGDEVAKSACSAVF